MSKVTDTYTMSIQVIQHGNAKIVLPITFPPSVEANTAFNITYTTKNEGVSDTLYGHLLQGGSELPSSSWSQVIAPSGTLTKTYNHSGIAVNTSITIEVGHQ
jgi:predicted phosphohydrolase